ncbi:MAG: hypothetical protein ACE5MM_07640 [Nitrospiraceae bacterium]
MTPPPQTPAQAAEAIYGILPHAVTCTTLEEYGIEASPEQAQQITREMLSLSLFWVGTALEAILSDADSNRIFTELRRAILNTWESEFRLKGHDVHAYFEEVEQRRSVYDKIMKEGGQPVSIFSETAAILESARLVRPSERQKVLALFVDLVPVEQVGAAVEEIDLTGQ